MPSGEVTSSDIISRAKSIVGIVSDKKSIWDWFRVFFMHIESMPLQCQRLMLDINIGQTKLSFGKLVCLCVCACVFKYMSILSTTERCKPINCSAKNKHFLLMESNQEALSQNQ